MSRGLPLPAWLTGVETFVGYHLFSEKTNKRPRSIVVLIQVARYRNRGTGGKKKNLGERNGKTPK